MLQVGFVSATTAKFREQCGNYQFIVTVDNPEEFYGRVIKLYFQKQVSKKKLFYQVEDEHISAFCIKDKNLDLSLFNEHCYGSGCIETIYGIYVHSLEKFILNPKEWPKGNDHEVKNILGVDPNVKFSTDKSFCCVNQRINYQINKD